MEKVKHFFITYKNDFLGILWMCLGCFLFGQILVGVIGLIDNNPTTIPIGTIIMGFGSFGLVILWGGLSLESKFNLQLSMGATRKEILSQYMIYLLVSVFIIWCMNLLSLRLEKVLHLYVFRFQPEGKNIYGVLNDILVGSGRIYLVAAGLSVLVGAANLKLGRVVFWIFYAAFIILCQVPNLINMKVKGEARDSLYNVIAQFMMDSTARQWVVCAVITLICLAFSWLILKKQRCTL